MQKPAVLSEATRNAIGGTLLDIRDLTVEFATRRGPVTAIQRVGLTVAKGERVAIVGESGSGKSVTSYAVLRILDRAGRIAQGGILFSGMDLVRLSEGDMADLRGRELSMIFQNPRAALNPVRRIGHQIEDVLERHAFATSANARRLAIETLERVQIARAKERYHAYPFELSGGMCQRVVIALALACRPQLLIADEPTTGLDVTTQKAVMDLIVELTREQGMSLILITHDLALAAQYSDRVVVLEKGRVVEAASSSTIFRAPTHPYTKKLMRATPRPEATLRDLLPEEQVTSRPTSAAAAPSAPPPLLRVTGLTKAFRSAHGVKGAPSEAGVRAVDGISFSVARGESVGLVGESGCGKSTTALMIARLIDPTAGRIEFAGADIASVPARKFAGSPLRPRIQMVFQDATESLNPRFTAARAIAEPLARLGKDNSARSVRARSEQLARLVGLPAALLERFPHQLSGGEKARVGIARAIALEPDLVILDEPTAALDVSVQAVVLNLLQDLKDRLAMSYIFVSHDLNVVRLLCERVMVMQGGRIIEQGPTAQVLSEPQAAYTAELLAAIPRAPI
jgi:peptide/nickel transport system ATP-binding protein